MAVDQLFLWQRLPVGFVTAVLLESAGSHSSHCSSHFCDLGSVFETRYEGLSWNAMGIHVAVRSLVPVSCAASLHFSTLFKEAI